MSYDRDDSDRGDHGEYDIYDHDDEYALMRGWGPIEPAGLRTPQTPPQMEPVSLILSFLKPDLCANS